MTAQPFELLVTQHGPTVMRVCRALLGPDDANDAWSDTFLVALRAYPSLEPNGNVRGWLVTIAHRKALDVIRARARAPQPSATVPDSAVHEETTVDGFRSIDGAPDDIEAALASLPFKQRGAVTYHHLGGLPYREVGILLDCSEAAARRSAADGIAKLRAHYERQAAGHHVEVDREEARP